MRDSMHDNRPFAAHALGTIGGILTHQYRLKFDLPASPGRNVGESKFGQFPTEPWPVSGQTSASFRPDPDWFPARLRPESAAIAAPVVMPLATVILIIFGWDSTYVDP